MKKRKYYLDKYYFWMQSGEMPTRGLCASLNWPDELDLFRPIIPGTHNYFTYWAGRNDVLFTPLRQNIVLFMAAMNNEL